MPFARQVGSYGARSTVISQICHHMFSAFPRKKFRHGCQMVVLLLWLRPWLAIYIAFIFRPLVSTPLHPYTHPIKRQKHKRQFGRQSRRKRAILRHCRWNNNKSNNNNSSNNIKSNNNNSSNNIKSNNKSSNNKKNKTCSKRFAFNELVFCIVG